MPQPVYVTLLHERQMAGLHMVTSRGAWFRSLYPWGYIATTRHVVAGVSRTALAYDAASGAPAACRSPIPPDKLMIAVKPAFSIASAASADRRPLRQYTA